MKLLYMVPYLTIDEEPTLSRHKSGFGYMVRDIIESTCEDDCENYIITQSYFTLEKQINNFVILQRTMIDILKNINLEYFDIYKYISKYDIPFHNKLRYFFYFLNGGYIESVIKSVKPDVVHIHGIDFSTIPFIIACIKTDTPFLLTLHGVNSLNDSVLVNKYHKKMEIELIKLGHEKHVKISVISTGIKKRLEEIVGSKMENMRVVTNGAKLLITNSESNSTKKIVTNKKVFIAVGNISKNKNQMQILRSLKLLPMNLLLLVKVIFVGNDNTNGEFTKLIKELELEEFVEYVGAVDRNEISKYYKLAHYNITASIDEGFGLSIIEAFQFGIPTVCFNDIDAIHDVYDDKCLLLINDRSDESLAQGILNATEIKWDSTYIKEYSKKFTLESMSRKYKDIYSNELSNTLSINDIKLLIKKLSERE